MNARAVRFVIVGAAGFAVQTSVVAGLLAGGWPYVPAAAAGVEAAVLHNFVWHACWTWKGRAGEDHGWLGRLARFHVANGLNSVAGSVIFTTLLVEAAAQPPVVANALAVGLTAAVNYVVADRWVFESRP